MRLTKILKQLQTKKKKNQNSKVCNFATYFSMRVGIFFLSFFFFKKTYLSMCVGLFFFFKKKHKQNLPYSPLCACCAQNEHFFPICIHVSCSHDACDIPLKVTCCMCMLKIQPCLPKKWVVHCGDPLKMVRLCYFPSFQPKFWFLSPKLSTENSNFYLKSSQPKFLMMCVFSPFKKKKLYPLQEKEKYNSYFSK